MSYIQKQYNSIVQFDSFTNFRLQNLFFVTIAISLISPVMADLKGELLAAYVISIFMIFEQLAVKVNRFLVDRFTLSQIYKLGIPVHLLYTLCAGLYWINPTIMIITDMTLAIIIMATFNTYTIKLNSHLSENHPNTMTEFQIVRNSIAADAFLIGLGISSCITFFFGIQFAIGLFIIYNFSFALYLMKKWNFFDPKN